MQHLAKLLLITLITFTLSSCAILNDEIVYDYKKEGDVSIKSVRPGWLVHYPLTTVRLALVKTSKMKSDEIGIRVVKDMNNEIKSENGLEINIDGKKSVFTSPDSYTKLTYNQYPTKLITAKEYSKIFVVPVQTVKDMLQGQNVIVRVRMEHEFYAEGQFNQTGDYSAKDMFETYFTYLSAD